MALQDLTPQLRTRLNHVERAVGWFVILAALLLIFGFGYYVYSTAERKGWFKTKAPYYTYVDSASGLKVGDPVQMMGFKAGKITKIEPEKAEDFEHNVFIGFEIDDPYYGYLWTKGSKAKVSSGLLENRTLVVTKGSGGYATYLFNPFREDLSLEEAKMLPELGKWRLGEEIYDPANANLVLRANQPLSSEVLKTIGALGIKKIRAFDSSNKKKSITAVWNDQRSFWTTYGGTNSYLLVVDEAPALADRAEALVAQIEVALPNFLRLTNQIYSVLSNAYILTGDLHTSVDKIQPSLANLNTISSNLTNRQGALGDWLIPTNVNAELAETLAHVNLTLTNANTNLAGLAGGLALSLENLAGITSNLNNQVQANTNILTHLSDIVVHSDDFIQGLKRHWLLRSAFRKPETNAPPARPVEPALSPRGKAERGK